MKKILFYSLTACMVMLGFTSCNDDEDALSDTKLTYYVDLQMQGDEFMLVPIGTPFVDPGCKAELSGEDYTSNIITTGVSDVDVNQVGFYDIVYSAVNPDGYAASATRTVCVYDPSVTESLAGSYQPDMTGTKYGTKGYTFADYAASYGNTAQCTGITFTEEAPGIYYVNDIFAGWYWQIRAYGTKYCMTAYVNLDKDNTVHLLSSYISGWGDSLDYLENGKYDPETGGITYSLSYAGQIFMDIVLNKE